MLCVQDTHINMAFVGVVAQESVALYCLEDGKQFQHGSSKVAL